MWCEQRSENGKNIVIVHPICGEEKSDEFRRAVQKLKESKGEVRVMCVKEKKQPRFTMYKTPIYSKRG